MNRSRETAPQKRKRGDSNSLTQSPLDAERILYDLIKKKEDSGMWTGDMKKETNLPHPVVTKALKSLQTRNLIKEVVNFQNKTKKHFMAVEFEPSKELTGGAWYVDGNLDMEFIRELKKQCVNYINKMKVATIEGVSEFVKKSSVFNVECTTQQIAEIMKALVLDNEIMEVRSTGLGDHHSIPSGTVCYRCSSKGGQGGGLKVGGLASVPCGVCPHIGECTPDGKISPKTCVYFTKWLDF